MKTSNLRAVGAGITSMVRTIQRLLKRRVMLGLALVVIMAPAQAAKVGGVEMPDTLDIATPALTLNGAGKRTKLVAKLYVAGLYLTSPLSGAQAIVDANEVMALRLHITSSLINAKRMEKATREGFENSAGGDLAAIADRVDKMIAVFQSGVAEGDIYEFLWVPEKGTRIIKNDAEAALIEGLDFKSALFGIWLGNQPAQKSLKADLLGE